MLGTTKANEDMLCDMSEARGGGVGGGLRGWGGVGGGEEGTGAGRPSAQTPTLTYRLLVSCPRALQPPPPPPPRPPSPSSARPTPAWVQGRGAHTTILGQAVSHGVLGPAEARTKVVSPSCQPSSKRTLGIPRPQLLGGVSHFHPWWTTAWVRWEH